MALGIHGAILGLIYLHIVVTKLLLQASPVLVSVVTGVVFPTATFAVRKVMFSIILTHLQKKAAAGEIDDLQKSYFAFSKGMSIMLLLTPACLLYFNVDLKYALASAMMQLGTEIVGKTLMIWKATKTFEAIIKDVTEEGKRVKGAMLKVAHLKETPIEEEGDGSCKDEDEVQDGEKKGGHESGGAEHPFEDTSSKEHIEHAEKNQEEDEIEKQKLAMAMLAIRMNSDIIAEKGSILAAALIVYFLFSEDTGGDLFVLHVAIVLFTVEVIADVCVAYIADRKMGVPLLSAVPEAAIFSKENLKTTVILGLTFNGMFACIHMAANSGM